MIDLRSDTMTKPTPTMRRAMAEAEVGDDVFGEDPTVNRLQERMAELMGKEAALFVPSGSMANQTAIRAQTEAGDEIILHEMSHAYLYEAGGPAGLSGCSYQFLSSDGGVFTAEQVRGAIRPTESHYAQSRLILIENTHNRGGGTIWPLKNIREIRAVADELGLSMHLDGARLMNACVASGHEPTDYARYFDTVSMCFSKGLGAPVGSCVMGSRDLIRRVHRFRKMFGGGMRQAGVLAAAAIHALDHHVERLVEDHINARRLAVAIAESPGLSVDVDAVQTNIVYVDVDESLGSARCVADRLDEAGVRVLPVAAQRFRIVAHLDVSNDDVERAIDIINNTLKAKAATA